MERLRRRPLLLLAALVLGLFVAITFVVRRQLPPIFSLADYQPIQASEVFASGGERIGTFALERRTAVAFSALPAHVVHAFLAAEDADFYTHEGIDWLGVGRALIKNMRPGAHLQGASTITQQTVKTLILGPERSLWRKIKEAVLARRLEQMLPKDEILVLYLNQIYFGNGAWGIEQAAQTYFAKHVSELDLFEAALLAGIPKNPSRYTLSGDAKAAKRRQAYVLRQMVAHRWATPEAAKEAQRRPLPLMPEQPDYIIASSAYVEHVRRQLADWVGDESLNTGGLRIYTQLDVQKQLAAAGAMAQGLEDVARRQGYKGPPGRIDMDVLATGLLALKKAFAQLTQDADAGLAAGGRAVKTLWMWDLSGLGAAPRTFGQMVGRHMQVLPLVPYARARALVLEVPASNGPAVVDLGGAKALLPLANLAWARTYRPQTRTPRPRRVSDVIQAGDLISVEVQPRKTTLPTRADEDVQWEVALLPEVQVQGALVAMAPPNAAVVAMVGSRDPAATGFNRATQAKRQPGSAFKPILYAAGLQEHTITPASPCSDSPVVIADPWTGAVWKPENYEDGRYDGTILYRTALARSKNTCSVRLLQKVGLEATMAMTQALGVDAPMPKNLTLSLGTGEVTPMMMAQAMHTIDNGGLYVAPQFVRRVTDAKGQPVPLPPLAPGHQAVSADVAYVLTSMMRSVVESGTARRARVLGRPLAAKTGTSQLSRDAWLVGFAPSLASVVWMGFDDDSSMGAETGASAALPAWIRFMGTALAGEAPAEFVMPDGVQPARIDPATGMLSDAPDAVVEVFVRGTQPSTQSQPLPSIFLEDDDPGHN